MRLPKRFRAVKRARTKIKIAALLATVSWGLTACSGKPEAKTGAAAAPTLPAATPAAAAPPTAAGSSTAASVPESSPAGDASEVTPTPNPSRLSARDRGARPATGGPGKPGKPESLADKAKRDSTLIVIDEPSRVPPESLAEAARRAREERGEAPRRKIVINDDNLAEYATGQLTVAAPEAAIGESSASRSAGSTANDPSRDEDHWRQGTRELRLKLRRAWDDTQTLSEQVAGLRTRFYAEDDPYVRDAEIKPAWDRALDRQRQAELEVEAYRRELDEFLDEGRRAGALPGWLREGIEYEPDFGDEEEGEATEAVDGFDRHRPVEPERMENPSRPPGR